MAIESKRGCGYRKVGGIYLVSDAQGFSCDRLPFPLHVCPTCGEGIKFSRGWTWIKPYKLFDGDHFLIDNQDVRMDCQCEKFCPACYPSLHFIHIQTDENLKAGLLWIGEKYYTPESFKKEANELGISKRISTVPRNFKVGITWVFLAHIKGCQIKNKEGFPEDKPAIFMAFQPRRIEQIVLQSEYDHFQVVHHYCSKQNKSPEEAFAGQTLLDYRKLQKIAERGISLVPVPDEDKDHNPDALNHAA